MRLLKFNDWSDQEESEIRLRAVRDGGWHVCFYVSNLDTIKYTRVGGQIQLTLARMPTMMKGLVSIDLYTG